MDCVTLTVFIVIVVLGLGLAVLQLYLLAEKGVIYWYLGAYFTVILGVALIAVCRRHTHDLHCHHYILFGLIIPLTGT
jgi:uncharacterized membrane protein YhaH (DUF805 family)